MDPAEIRKQLASLTGAIETFETNLSSQHVPLEIISDFKSSIDDLRLRLWGLLTAGSIADREAFQHRFRLRRAGEMCLGMAAEIRHGGLRVDRQELDKLLVALRSLEEAADEAMPSSPGTS